MGLFDIIIIIIIIINIYYDHDFPINAYFSAIMSGLAGCLEDEDSLGGKGPLFNPPLYKQRYSAVLHIARKLKPRKVGGSIFYSYVSML